jgi:hypothetical protein
MIIFFFAKIGAHDAFGMLLTLELYRSYTLTPIFIICSHCARMVNHCLPWFVHVPRSTQ